MSEISENSEISRLVKKAEKRLKSWFGGDDRYFEAAELYEQAGNLAKMRKDLLEASRLYHRGTECLLEIDGYQAAGLLVKASNCAQQSGGNLNLAFGGVSNLGESQDVVIDYLEQARDLYLSAGHFGTGARQQKSIAEIYATRCDLTGGGDENDLRKVVSEFERAVELFSGEGNLSMASKCRERMGTFLIRLEDYGRAVQVYEELGRSLVDHGSLKFQAKKWFLYAGLCHLANGDVVGASRAIGRYGEMCVSFIDSREAKLLSGALSAVENYDSAQLTSLCLEYDRASKLEDNLTKLLLKVKKSIETKEELSSGDSGDDDLL